MIHLFLKCVNLGISAGWIILAVLLIRFVFQKAPKWLNPILWSIVGLRLILPFSIESAFSLMPNVQIMEIEIVDEVIPNVQSNIPVLNLNNEITIIPESTQTMDLFQWLLPIASILWVIGIIAMLIFSGSSYWRLYKRVQTAVLLQENIYQSEHVVTPFVLGLFHPRIYIPFNLSDCEKEYIIAHEKTHIKRGDHFLKPITYVLLTLFWFHPLMWIAYQLFCKDIELACDERVIQTLNDTQRAGYLQTLLTCSTRTITRKMIVTCPLAFGEVGVGERIHHILKYKKKSFWIQLVAVGACIFLTICFLTNPKQDDTIPKDSTQIEEWLESIQRSEQLQKEILELEKAIEQMEDSLKQETEIFELEKMLDQKKFYQSQLQKHNDVEGVPQYSIYLLSNNLEEKEQKKVYSASVSDSIQSDMEMKVDVYMDCDLDVTKENLSIYLTRTTDNKIVTLGTFENITLTEDDYKNIFYYDTSSEELPNITNTWCAIDEEYHVIYYVILTKDGELDVGCMKYRGDFKQTTYKELVLGTRVPIH